MSLRDVHLEIGNESLVRVLSRTSVALKIRWERQSEVSGTFSPDAKRRECESAKDRLFCVRASGIGMDSDAGVSATVYRSKGVNI